MAIINCIDCGKGYDSELNACPNCGCPTASQITHTEQLPQQSTPIQNKEQLNENGSKKKKLILWILPIILSGIVAAGIIYYHGDSYGRKIAQFNKKANEFKATLDSNCQVISETIDSITQKVFYIEKNMENYDYHGEPYHKIMVHDYATDETKPVLPYTGKIDDYSLCGVEFIDSKLLGDRLFFMVRSNCRWRLAETGIFYVNIRDNSLHYVESCNKAEFLGLNEICIHKYYDLRRYENEGATDYKEYNLSTMLDDIEYAENRQKQKKIEKELAEERWKIEEMNDIKEWLVGTWECSGYDEWLGRYSSYVCITENSLRLGYNGQDIYNGQYEIDLESHSIIFDRHDGYYTHIGFNPQTKRLEDEDGVFRKVSNCGNVSYNSSSYEARNGNNYSTINFRTDTDVISYTSSHTFKNNVGNRIKINFQGMYVNGSLLTNAPRVLNFSGSSATISVSSPYTGGGALIIKVDASRGTITDGSGDVFRMVN